MKAIVAAVMMALSTAACARQVEVGTSPDAQQSEVSVHMTNNLNQPVNVYVVSGGTELFLGQVAANSSQHLQARGIASGSSVTLRARSADGTRTFSRDNVVLAGMFAWQVP